MKVFLLVAISILLSCSIKADMIDKTGMQPWEICALCHGLTGNSATARFPKLAGQKPQYIKNQINAFLTGTRTNDGGQMSSIVTEVNESEIELIADYFSQQLIESDTPNSEAQETQNRPPALVSNCLNCHNTKEDDAIPHLSSQHKGYLEKQLTDFKEGNRTNPIMTGIAQSLSANDIEEIAEYFSKVTRKTYE